MHLYRFYFSSEFRYAKTHTSGFFMLGYNNPCPKIQNKNNKKAQPEVFFLIVLSYLSGSKT
jgi:hypothetical protein